MGSRKNSREIRRRERERLLARLGEKSLKENNGSAVSPSPVASQQQQVLASAFTYHEQHFTGPIPPPNILSEYDARVPGLAKIIVEQFVEQSTHRRWAEKYHLESNSNRSWCGLACGLVVAIGGLTAAVFLGGWAGAALGALDLVALVAVFVYGSQGQQHEREEKSKNLANKKAGRK